MFKKRLREERLRLKLTQESIADKLGLASSSYALYEQGRREPDLDTLKKLADIFDVTTDYLLGRTDHKQTEILEGDQLPPKLRGIIDAVGVLKGTGLSEEDIQDILKLHADIEQRKKNT
jgi:transcriptional regulator with XRE-family HTH domain